jgi:hypothetical protein
VTKLRLLQVQRAGDPGAEGGRRSVREQLSEGAAVARCRLPQELPHVQETSLYSALHTTILPS